jgi:enoyl-CoA hydratase/carnithine racemase
MSETTSSELAPGSPRSADDTVLYEHLEDHIVRITLNRPERRNAILVPDMHQRLLDLVQTAEDDDDVKCIILAGAGKFFCAGDDTNRVPAESFGLKKDQKLPQSRRIRGISKNDRNRILYCDKTVISAVQGGAFGLGFNFALSSDLIIAAEGAKFARKQTRIGFAGFDVLLPIVMLKLGINRGYDLVMTGRTVTAEDLRDWGVVSSVVPEEELPDEALRYARAVARHSTDGLMLGRQAKKLFWDNMGIPEWQTFVSVAHPLFSNLVWRDDEINLLKERARLGSGGAALKAVHARWEELGFD